MAKITFPEATTAAALHAAYERRAAEAVPGSDQDWRRDHLGASVIGNTCDRYLWLSFRWALNPKHEGRMLRLFDRGTREEAWLIDDLRAAGFDVQDRDPETGEQWRFTFGGHVGGSLDGIITGLLEASKTPHDLEVKTHSKKSFEKLEKDGVRRSKPVHYTQMQIGMRGRKLDRAYYLAVCKDDDRIYAERVHLDIAFADAAIARARSIVDMPEPPARQESPDFPPCLYTSKEGETWPCQFRDLCFGSAVPEKNCRTCVDSSPIADGAWKCGLGCSMTPQAQRLGCPSHLTIPGIHNAEITFIDEADRRIEYQRADGSTFVDGGRQ